MAKYDWSRTKPIYDLAQQWKDDALLTGRSLLWEGQATWTQQNVSALVECFVQNQSYSSETFIQKFEKQLKGQPTSVIQLAVEILLIYFLFPNKVNLDTKIKQLKLVASWGDAVEIEEDRLRNILVYGIGGAGGIYNRRRPFELAYIILVCERLLSMTPEDRRVVLEGHKEMRVLMDSAIDGYKDIGGAQSRHILLHLLYPDYFERIATVESKRQIVHVFGGLLDNEKVDQDVDDMIYEIRQQLCQILGTQDIDFYHEGIYQVWDPSVESGEQLSPLEALKFKRQIVLYGPPGTGKTHTAKVLADRIIRGAILGKWGAAEYFRNQAQINEIVAGRTERVQLHPSFGYEEMVRGLHLEDGGKTGYKSGVILHIRDRIEQSAVDVRDLPFVLILDEMNRADLSKVLGECFSLLENRDEPVLLAGQANSSQEMATLTLPQNLYVIGTMNLVDQSLEYVDFALRRRFLWFSHGFDRESLLRVSESKWKGEKVLHGRDLKWEEVALEFEELSRRAENLNVLIAGHYQLGKHYEIGHTYFTDVVSFAKGFLTGRSQKTSVLFNRKGDAKPAVTSLWKFSLRPLLEQYLSGTDQNERDTFLRTAEATFLDGSSK